MASPGDLTPEPPVLAAGVADPPAPQVESTVPIAVPAEAPTSKGTTPGKLSRSLARPLWYVAILLTLGVMYFAAQILVPLVLAILIALTLAPAVRALNSVRIPRSLAAAIVVATGLAVAASVFVLLAEPAQAWFKRAPGAMRRLEFGMRGLLKPLEQASQATESLMRLGQKAAPAAGTAPDTNPAIAVLYQAPVFIGTILLTVFLVFLFLMYGDALLRKFVTVLPALSQKKDLVSGTREAQRELSMYLVTITAINVMVGVITALALWWLGVPDAVLWGGVAAILNYAPYLGAVMTLAIFLVVGFAEFTDPWKALSVPGVFAIINIFEGQLVTPLLVGRRLAIDPVVIFVSLMLFGWMWGITGMLLAVPILSCMRIVASKVQGGGTLALILADHSEKSSPEAPRA